MIYLLLYSITIGLSAFAFFWIQPMAAKIILPIFGGVPSVWLVCMMFYQFILLLGYCYAHFLSRIFKIKYQVIINTTILLICGISLLFINEPILNLNITIPSLSVIALLFLNYGIPIFVLSTNAPLMQKWFSYTKHHKASDPYFLYAASNIGSLSALLLYPFLIEYSLDIPNQIYLWLILLSAILILTFLCGTYIYKNQQSSLKASFANLKNVEKVATIDRLKWLILAFIPSSMLLGVTNHIILDLVSVPMLWIIPLAIYLLTYILAFSDNDFLKYKTTLSIQPYCIMILMIILPIYIIFYLHPIILIILHLICFFFLALHSHNKLVSLRPHKHYLTDFYIFIAIGGLLGGIFNSLIAPALFDNYLEYPISIALAAFIRPFSSNKKTKSINIGDFLNPVVVFALLLLARRIYGFETTKLPIEIGIIAAIAILYTFYNINRPVRFGLLVTIVLLFNIFWGELFQQNILFDSRNFFGTLKVVDFKDKAHILLSGTTVHGAEFNQKDQRAKATTYYAPLDSVFWPILLQNKQISVAIAGLGMGALSCFFRAEDNVDYYEINPDMIKVAQNTKYFSQLSQCPPHKIILGDARIKLKESKNKSYNVIVLDAFSSDSIPIHLLTKEAIELYLTKLTDNGTLVFNVSNRFLDLSSLLKQFATHFKMQAFEIKATTASINSLTFSSHWVILTNDKKLIASIKKNDWQELKETNQPMWTDNYSNIIPLLKGI